MSQSLSYIIPYLIYQVDRREMVLYLQEEQVRENAKTADLTSWKKGFKWVIRCKLSDSQCSCLFS
ncbi:hypothetical protein Krac_9254 [Ktedonobacter racemifer DSM 44963]|uniref:Uncharacterized protein n=1 Tax=Ktedonobacter racemifer DSM 44963 TaxID=485913 RepID=D6TBB8_KTERA|nr:hypothetical protein Krac_9254 [Ktedonobacter racemifer DSM 44963]